MYIPKHYGTEDRKEMLSFMRQYPFGTIITAADQYPVASHLPFTISDEHGHCWLRGHFAKANPQWKQIEVLPVLVIFSEPHAYISPSHYDKPQNVPTWNYMAVHAYGKARLVPEAVSAMKLIESMISVFEQSYQQQWNALPDDYKHKMLNAIVAFEITITELQGKKKLSQNKTPAEQQRIINTLSASPHTQEQEVARLMEQHLKDET